MPRNDDNKPIKAQSRGGSAVDAWWYAESNCIDVCIECQTTDGIKTVGIARISKDALDAAFKKVGG